MSLAEMIDKAKTKTGSDYRTAQRLGISRSAISHMRKTNQISNDTARQLAELVDCSPLDIIAAAEIAKHPERADSWKKWAGTAAILTVGIIGFFSYSSETYSKTVQNNLYIMRTFGALIVAVWSCRKWNSITYAAKHA